MRALILAGLLLSGCSVETVGKRLSDPIGTGKVIPFTGSEGRWTGTVHPTQNDCGSDHHGLMRIGDGAFALDPFTSSTVIKGKVDGDMLTGALTRVGGEHRMVTIRFDGRLRRNADGNDLIEGTIVSGKCSWQVALSRG